MYYLHDNFVKPMQSGIVVSSGVTCHSYIFILRKIDFSLQRFIIVLMLPSCLTNYETMTFSGSRCYQYH